MSYDEKTNEPVATEESAIVERPLPKLQRKPNRHERRQMNAIIGKAKRAHDKAKENRSIYYSILQKWLSENEFPKEVADEIFKRTLKKLFKNDYKSKEEFYGAISASISSLRYVPIEEPLEPEADKCE